MLAAAIAAVRGSRSTASDVVAARESPQVAADAAAEICDPLHGTIPRGAVGGDREPLVACSNPAWVKYIRSASSPNFVRARARRRTCVIAAATSGAG